MKQLRLWKQLRVEEGTKRSEERSIFKICEHRDRVGDELMGSIQCERLHCSAFKAYELKFYSLGSIKYDANIAFYFISIEGLQLRWLERTPDKREVDGSIPFKPTTAVITAKLT